MKGKRGLAVILCLAGLAELYACGRGEREGTAAPSVQISTENMEAHLAALAGHDDARIAGSAGEETAAAYIARYFTSLGLEPMIREFPIVTFHAATSALELISADSTPAALTHRVFPYSGSTGGAWISGELADAGLGRGEDFAGLDLGGRIALMERGEITFTEKVANAARAGAVGAVIYNTDPENSIIGTLIGGARIPAVSVNGSIGRMLAAECASGPAVVRLLVDAELRDSISRNVTAVLPAAEGDTPGRFVIVGAHLDSVDTPGANDNGSGIAALLETARVAAGLSLPLEVRFMAFGAEEIGLDGSRAAAAALSAEATRCAGMINLDTIGMGDTLMIYTTPGSSFRFAGAVAETAERLRIPFETGSSTASDHSSFARLGIPSVFLMREPTNLYHTDMDTIETVDPAALEQAVRLTIEILMGMK